MENWQNFYQGFICDTNWNIIQKQEKVCKICKGFGGLFPEDQIIYYENHDLAIARSSSSRADPGLKVAFKCLNV